ncbi:MAG: TlpA family protein disulfide reductase [Burkholderiales bacterium]
MKRILVLLCLGVLTLPMAGRAFSFTDTEGKRQQLAAYHGKWVLVNFWATWCPPCLAEIPDLVALFNAHRDRDLVVIGVAMEDQYPERVARFVKELKISYPVVLGNSKLAAQVGSIEGLPQTYLYNPKGKLVAQRVGPVTRQSIEAYIGAKP